MTGLLHLVKSYFCMNRKLYSNLALAFQGDHCNIVLWNRSQRWLTYMGISLLVALWFYSQTFAAEIVWLQHWRHWTCSQFFVCDTEAVLSFCLSPELVLHQLQFSLIIHDCCVVFLHEFAKEWWHYRCWVKQNIPKSELLRYKSLLTGM